MTTMTQKTRFSALVAMQGVMVILLGGAASTVKADDALSLPQRMTTWARRTSAQAVGHRTASAERTGHFRRSLARKMTAFVPRRELSLQTGSPCICPVCDHVCNLDAKQVDVEQSCFEVESKVICIPRVVFPWQKNKNSSSCDACDGAVCSCVNNGAKTREIRVLKVEKYKCPECKYTWSAENRPCVTCCDSGCDTVCQPGCDSACEAGCDYGCPAVGPYSSQPMTYREFDPSAVQPLAPSDMKVHELKGPRE